MSIKTIIISISIITSLSQYQQHTITTVTTAITASKTTTTIAHQPATRLLHDMGYF
jgi:hypothetical protein